MKLRNYDLYLKKIKAYCKSVELEIQFVEVFEGEGEYRPNRRKVIIATKDFSESQILSTLLHEIGHFEDDLRNPKRFSQKYHYWGYEWINQERNLTLNQKEAVLRAELSAWKNARALALKLRIPLGKWFKKDERESLNTYRAVKTV